MRRLLVLEDDERLRGALVRALAKRGYEVEQAAELAALASVDGARLDGAIVDLALPDGSGIDAIRALSAANPALRIVVLTGYGSIASAVDAVRGGAVDYLTKPADVDQILAVLDPGAAAREPARALAPPSLGRVEWEHIQRVLHDCDGNVTRAAKALGIHRRTLQRKLAYRPPER
ncbi:MAG: response regulator [Myxococcota bacterium]|nr:response regulator [Myxococcales bacterium]